MLATLLLSGLLLTNEPDTIATAVVSAERGISVSRTDTLATVRSQNLTDLLLQSPGLVVADYGGYPGIKSVNLRGLGSPHTAIYIDGIKVGNVQTGQPDLGLLGLENFSGAIIDYAQNSVNFNTARPQFNGRRVAGKAAFSVGSFGSYFPSARMDFRLGDRLSLSANAAGLVSRGDFPYGDGRIRENNDVRQIRAGLDFFGLADGGDWMAKVCCNSSDRGTPGSADWPSTDRQQDRNAFVQGLLRKSISPIYSLNLSAKAAYDDVHYASEWGDSDYGQTELQLNSAHKFHVSRWLDLSAVAEFQHDGLKSTLYDASRDAVTAIAGAAVKLARLSADFTLQYEGLRDRDAASHNIISPSADVRFRLSEGLDIIGFARRAFRAPTFNELYYPGYGNPDLRPEDAWLTDIGIDWRRACGGIWAVHAKIDGFYNRLTDKIVSAPSEENPAVWLPYNIGEVHAKGIDADAGLSLSDGGWKAGFNARYSFQDADNVPYLAKHTVVLSADASFRGWALNTVWNYRGGRTDAYSPMPDWNTLDIVLGKTVFGNTTLKFICRNLADCRYELVSGYPMQGRSLTGAIEYRF